MALYAAGIYFNLKQSGCVSCLPTYVCFAADPYCLTSKEKCKLLIRFYVVLYSNLDELCHCNQVASYGLLYFPALPLRRTVMSVKIKKKRFLTDPDMQRLGRKQETQTQVNVLHQVEIKSKNLVNVSLSKSNKIRGFMGLKIILKNQVE